MKTSTTDPKPNAITLCLWLVLAMILSGVAFLYWQGQKNCNLIESVSRDLELSAKYKDKGKVVFARKNIAAGAVILPDYVEEREHLLHQIPPQSAIHTGDVVGRKARFAVEKDTIVSGYDLDPYPRYLPVLAVQATKLIRRGSPIRDDAVELVQSSGEDLTDGHYEKISEVLGRLARHDIISGQLLTKEQIVPRRFEIDGSMQH